MTRTTYPCDWCFKPVNLNRDEFAVTGPESEYIKCAACSGMAVARVAVSLSCSPPSRLGLVSVEAISADGRRFWYCYPDGQARDGIYVRELTPRQFERLCDGVRAAGGIDTAKPCWQEGDPVYGSVAYELSGTEMLWAERERVEAAWM